MNFTIRQGKLDFQRKFSLVKSIMGAEGEGTEKRENPNKSEIYFLKDFTKVGLSIQNARDHQAVVLHGVSLTEDEEEEEMEVSQILF